jgi:hypothetical protein
MRWLAAALSLLVALFGAVGVMWPSVLLQVARSILTPTGLYAAGALRVVLGGALFFAAPGSRIPTAMRVIGIVIVAAGLSTPFIGAEHARSLLEWGTGQAPGLPRVGGGFALGLGSFLLWALFPRSRS